MTLDRWPDTYQAVAPAQCEQMLADGAAGLMVGVWGGGYAGKGTGGLYDIMQANAETSLRNMRQAGGRTAIYTNAGPRWTYSWGVIGPPQWWEESQRAAGSEMARVSFIELDFEIADGGLYIQSDDMIAFVADLRTVGVPVIGYSGDWFCGLMHAGGQRYDYADILDGYNPAVYDQQPTLPASPSWPMHPRTIGKQYNGGSDLFGVNVDLNVIDAALYAPRQPTGGTQPAGGDDMALSDEDKQYIEDTAKRWAGAMTQEHINMMAELKTELAALQTQIASKKFSGTLTSE